MTFRFQSYRDYKTYSGEAAAIYDLLEIGARDLETRFSSKESLSKLQKHGEQYNLNVQLERLPPVSQKCIELNIVAVQDAFDVFLAGFKNEHNNLCQNSWKEYPKKTALYVAVQNICKTQANGREQIGEMPLLACKYYRLVRNGIVHSGKKQSEINKIYAKLSQFRKLIYKKYTTVSDAPNLPDSLTRDDYQLSVRASQDVAWRLSKIARPDRTMLCRIALEKKSEFERKWPSKESRVRTALIGYFKHRFGFSKSEIEAIISGVI